MNKISSTISRIILTVITFVVNHFIAKILLIVVLRTLTETYSFFQIGINETNFENLCKNEVLKNELLKELNSYCKGK